MLGGKMNIASLIKNAKKMEEMMKEKQAELANTIVTGEAGAGAVKVTMSADHQVKSVVIDDEVYNESKDVVTDLVTAAMNDALEKVKEVTKSSMGGLTDLLGG